jgi:hypothetical protein
MFRRMKGRCEGTVVRFVIALKVAREVRLPASETQGIDVYVSLEWIRQIVQTGCVFEPRQSHGKWTLLRVSWP